MVSRCDGPAGFEGPPTAVELIGRGDEIAQVVDRLARRRLVTLIGPAGIGKTALARGVASDVAASYELGSHVVDLTRVDAADAVAGAIAGQLGFASFEALLVSPSDQTVLVVIDNCEHVTAAAADAVAALLETCNAPTVLATSRSPLDLPDESLVVLGPLSLPAPGMVDAASDSVRLFLERAHDHGAVVPDEHLDAVVRLCRQLDGVPLAIELAAARARTMHPAEILARLADGIDVLSRPRFRGDPRHRSLAATIEWSYRLLPADVAALLDRLGLFAGPFTEAMAREVGADAGLSPAAATEALPLLVDSSLVVAEPGAPTTRFRLSETVKAFAVRRLEESGVLHDARSRLADHVIDVAAAAMPERIGRQWNAPALDRTLTQYDNVVAALRWCIAHDDDGTRALQLTAALWGVVHQGHSDEIATLSRQAIERWPDPAAPYAADAVATAATAVYLMGDPGDAFEMAARALTAASASPTAFALLRRAMAYAATALGRRDTALELYGDVSDHARRHGLTALAMEADVNRALLLADRDLAGAVALAREVRAEAAAAGSAVNEVWALSALGHLLLREDSTAGLATVSEALDEGRRIRFPGAIGVNLRTLAWGLTRTGQHRAAAEALLELYDNLLGRGQVADIRGALLTTAELLHAVRAEAWVTLAATAESLPLVGPLGSTMDALVLLPPHDVAALTRRDAVSLAKQELRDLLARAEEPTAPPEPAPAGVALAVASMTEHGDYWAVTFAGRTIHAKASKGMADLRRLLSNPGREVHSLELMGAGVEQSSTGEVLDQTARRQYERRVRELQDDIDAAESDNDYTRADRARIELDTLVDHLTAALGLGGRSRRGGGTAERARSAVTQRIRSTIRRLGAAHPELGRHLSASITTGTYCVYRPEHPVDWQL